MSLSPHLAKNDMIHLEKFLPTQQELGFNNHHLCPALSNYLDAVIHQCELYHNQPVTQKRYLCPWLNRPDAKHNPKNPNDSHCST